VKEPTIGTTGRIGPRSIASLVKTMAASPGARRSQNQMDRFDRYTMAVEERLSSTSVDYDRQSPPGI
jgi:hypothetical protein